MVAFRRIEGYRETVGGFFYPSLPSGTFPAGPDLVLLSQGSWDICPYWSGFGKQREWDRDL